MLHSKGKGMSNWMAIISFIGMILIPFIAVGAPPETPEDSTALTLPTTPLIPSTVILIQQGYIDYPSPSSTITHTFTTNKGCPSQTTPYVELSLTKTNANTDGKDVLSGFGVCVQNINPPSAVGYNGTYTVTYYSVQRRGRVKSYKDDGLYVGTDKGAWTMWSTANMPGSYISNTYKVIPNKAPGSPDGSAPGGIRWSLYCFPSSMAVPASQADCNTSNSPFAP